MNPAALRPFAARRHPERGSALFLLLIMAVVMATIMGGIYSYINTTSKAEKRSNVRLESTYAAEAAFEQAYQQLRGLVSDAVSSSLPDAATTTTATNLSTAPTNLFTAADGYTWKSFLTVPIQGGVPVGAHTDFTPTKGIYKFLTVVEFERTVPLMKAPVHMQFQREWDYSLTPLFQYAIFYNSDMELFPGAAFRVSGRVHSNGRIHVGTSASITFSDFVTNVNGVSNHYKKPQDPRTEGGLTGPITYSKQAPVTTSRQSPPGDLNADTSDANHNNDGPRELIELPNSWQTDANASDRMYTKAGLKVLVNTTGSDVTADSGVTVPANSKVFMTQSGTVITGTLATYLQTLVTNGSTSTHKVYDYREGAQFTTTNVDVTAVATAQDNGGLPATIPSDAKWPNNATVPATLKNTTIPEDLRGKALWNGVMYVTDVTNSSTHRTGLKIVNGETLPDGSNSLSTTEGLTIATNNAAFIVGNFNTGGVPPVNSGAVTDANYVSGYTVQPASVLADAVTILSEGWSDSYDSSTSLSSRVATNTTVNAAVISGVVASDGVAYSGGVENYFRLLEKWNNRRLTYYGSIINVYPSQQSTHHWGGGYYEAANRNWYFDVNFLDPNKLPPGTPTIRSLLRGQWAQVE